MAATSVAAEPCLKGDAYIAPHWDHTADLWHRERPPTA
jgi:hypothetical protein